MPTLFNHPEDSLRAWPGRIHIGQFGHRFTMASRGRGAGFLHLPDAPQQRNAIVKPRVVSNQGKNGKNWSSHGVYLQKRGERGFDRDGAEIRTDQTLGQWQKEEEHYFNVIISPEGGNGLDLQEYTRSLMEEIEQDLGVKTQWVAVVHTHTPRWHIHLSIRGRDAAGKELRIDGEYLWGGIRQRARELTTERLGWRTKDEVDRMRERAVTARRWTQLDQELSERMDGRKIDGSGLMSPHEQQRLAELERRGLAWKDGQDWQMSLWWEKKLQDPETTREYKAKEHEHAEERRRRVRIIDDLEHDRSL
jgi:hypothetical protein